MLRVGLTGGIASGKSTISQLFADLGVSVIDTDIISRQLMQPGQPALQQTLEHFGDSIALPDGSLNRARLRQRIFNNQKDKQWLEALLHPLIRQQTLAEADRNADQPYCLIVVPLMYETGFDRLMDSVIAIDCPVDSQKARLIKRDSIDDALAERMLQAQLDNPERLLRADWIIHNPDNADPAPQVLAIHVTLLAQAASVDRRVRVDDYSG